MNAILEKKGFICDMDGVIYHGNRILDGVKDFVNWMMESGKKFVFLTNSPERTPHELSMKLKRMGLTVSADHFYTSAMATAEFLSSQAPGCTAYVIGEAALSKALYDKGIYMNDVNPEYVVIGETRTYNFEKLEKAIELVNKGAKLIGANPDTVYEITKLVKEAVSVPLCIKLSPNVTDIAAIGQAAMDGGADGLSLINTVSGMAIDLKTRKPVFHNLVAGLSGPCVKPIAVRMVYQTYGKTKAPIIGMGGVANGNDAVEFMAAGATLVSVGTMNFKDPFTPLKVIDGLNTYLDQNGISDVNEIIGCAHPGN